MQHRTGQPACPRIEKPSFDAGASMKRIRLVSTGVLLLLLGMTAPIYANQQQGQGKRQEGDNKQRGRDNKRQYQDAQSQQKAQQQRQDQDSRQQRRARQQQQDQERRQQQAQQQEQQQALRVQAQRWVAWRQHRATNWRSQHQTWRQRGGYNGYRVPQDRYRGYFGSDHRFRISSLPFAIVGGYPRFQYGGFWMSVVDPWPEYWSDNWYQNDDVYIEYSDDGYYMYNRKYPQDRIAISVFLN